jgi:hypothetical protein
MASMAQTNTSKPVKASGPIHAAKQAQKPVSSQNFQQNKVEKALQVPVSKPLRLEEPLGTAKLSTPFLLSFYTFLHSQV